MRKFGVAFARSLMPVAAFSMVAADVAQAQSAPAPPSKYPLKYSNGTSIRRGSQPGVESCTVHGLRAQPQFGKDTGPVYVGIELAFDDKGNRQAYGQVLIQPVETSVTNYEKRPVQVRIDLDGTTYDMPYGEVHQSIVTFLDFRFPAEVLNKIVNAKAMKVYFVDPATKQAKLFATADLSGGREAFREIAGCVETLPDLPTVVDHNWKLIRDPDGCALNYEMNKTLYGLARANNGDAALYFKEVDDPHTFEKPLLKIGGKPVDLKYRRSGPEDTPLHLFKVSATDLDRLTPEANVEISDGGEPIIGGTNLYPPAGLFYLKKCAAMLKTPAKAKK